MARTRSRAKAHTSQQQLSEAKERTLIRRNTSPTKTGFPASPAPVTEMAEEVRRNRLQLIANQPAPRAPPLQPHRAGLDALLPDSSLPDVTHLRESNQMFMDELAKTESPTSPLLLSAARWCRALEATQSEAVLLRRQLADAQARLQRRQQHRTSKFITLQAKFVVSIEEVREIAEQAEQAEAARKAKKRLRKDPNRTELILNQEELVLSVSTDSDSDTIVVRRRRLN